MEFYEEVQLSSFVNIDKLKKLLVIKNLPLLCSSISSIIDDNRSKGTIYCIWGEFRINREELKYGVRYSMPDCPNALVWSITLDDSTKNVVIYCTINKTEHEDDFILSVQEFVNAWKKGINQEIDKCCFNTNKQLSSII